MKKLFFLLILTSICSIIKAQNEFKKNDINIEAFGFGGFGSVNYERQLTKEPGIGARIGLGFYTEDALYVSIPVGNGFKRYCLKFNEYIILWVSPPPEV